MPISYRTLLIATVAAYAIGGVVLVHLYAPVAWPLDALNHAVGRDFVNVWAAGRLVLEGQTAVLFDIDAYHAALQRLLHPALPPHHWSYPPTSLLIAVPFGLLPYGWALAVWTSAGLAAFLYVGRLGLESEPARAVTALLVIAPASVNTIVCGQNGFFTAALLGGGFLLLNARPVLAGILLGLLSFKPQFGLVVVPALVALGAWRAMFAAAGAALLLVLASLLAFGLQPWHLFLETTVVHQTAMLEQFRGFFTDMLVSPYSALRHLGWSHRTALGAQLLLSASAVVAVMRLLARTRDREDILAVVAAAVFVISPYTLTYDMPILALAIARYAQRHPQWANPARCLLGLAWALPMVTVTLLLAGLPIPAVVLTGVLALLWTDANRRLGQGGERIPVGEAVDRAAFGPDESTARSAA